MREGRASSASSQRSRNFGWASILIVDDDEQNRQLLARAIARFGSQVRHAPDGQAALEAMATWRTDLVLLDITMPGLSGFDVLERMSADPQLRDINVIMVSASDDMESIVRALQLGAEGYIPKPCPLEVLRARIGGSLERMELRKERGAPSGAVLDGAGVRGGQPADSAQAGRAAERLRELLITTVRLNTLIAAELPSDSPLRAYVAEIDRAGREAGTIARELFLADGRPL